MNSDNNIYQRIFSVGAIGTIIGAVITLQFNIVVGILAGFLTAILIFSPQEIVNMIKRAVKQAIECSKSFRTVLREEIKFIKFIPYFLMMCCVTLLGFYFAYISVKHLGFQLDIPKFGYAIAIGIVFTLASPFIFVIYVVVLDKELGPFFHRLIFGLSGFVFFKSFFEKTEDTWLDHLFEVLDEKNMTSIRFLSLSCSIAILTPAILSVAIVIAMILEIIFVLDVIYGSILSLCTTKSVSTGFGAMIGTLVHYLLAPDFEIMWARVATLIVCAAVGGIAGCGIYRLRQGILLEVELSKAVTT